MNCFHEIKYHWNILAVHCNNVTNAKSAKLNSSSWGNRKIQYPRNIRLFQYFTLHNIVCCCLVYYVLNIFVKFYFMIEIQETRVNILACCGVFVSW